MKEIQLTQDKVAIVDDNDFEKLSKWKWHYHQGYASRNKTVLKGKRITWRMHYEVFGKPLNELEIDHINGNTLDNRRCNLRMCSHRNNTYNQKTPKNNTSGFKGVTWYKRYSKWMAQTMLNKKRINLGYFNNKIDAAKAYNDGAIKYFGKFAKLNKI